MIDGVLSGMFVIVVLFIYCKVWYGVIIIILFFFGCVSVVEYNFDVCCVNLFLKDLVGFEIVSWGLFF